jgi:NADPH:quinone reductase-like Zn-dependent oxidoreductase
MMVPTKFVQPHSAISSRRMANDRRLLAKGLIKPVVERSGPLEKAAEASRHLIKDRPFGRIVLTLARR